MDRAAGATAGQLAERCVSCLRALIGCRWRDRLEDPAAFPVQTAAILAVMRDVPAI